MHTRGCLPRVGRLVPALPLDLILDAALHRAFADDRLDLVHIGLVPRRNNRRLGLPLLALARLGRGNIQRRQ
eukprot:1586014-Prymnesium_polylepis.1